MICPSVKICDFLFFSFLFFFHCWCVHRVKAVLAPCWRSGKKKKDTARTPEFGKSYRYPCLTHVGHQYIAENGVLVIECLLEKWSLLRSLLQPCAPCWKSDLSLSSGFNSLQIQEFHNSSRECINSKWERKGMACWEWNWTCKGIVGCANEFWL